MKRRNFFYSLFFLFSFFLFTQSAQAFTYLQGDVTADGKAYTGYSYGSASLNCDNYKASDYGYIDKNGHYQFETGNNYYGPCSSYHSGTTFSECSVSASPDWNDPDDTIAPSDKYPVTLKCSQTTTQDIKLNILTQKIKVTVTVGDTPVTSGIKVSVSQQSFPWNYSSTSTNTNGVYELPAGPGTYYVSAYCDYPCTRSDLVGYPSNTVTVASTDTSVSTSLKYAVADKEIKVKIKAGKNLVKTGMTVNISQNESPYIYVYSSTPDSEGVYTLKVTSGNFTVSAYCTIWPCELTDYVSEKVTLQSSDSSVETTLHFGTANKTLRVKVLVGKNKEAITSGMTIYASELGGRYQWKSVTQSTDGTYNLTLSKGKYNVSGYCTYTSSNSDCGVSGYPSLEVTLEEDDETVDVTLLYLKNDATIDGVVTAGGSPLANVSVNASSHKISAEDVGKSTALTLGALVIKGSKVTESSYSNSTSAYSYATTDASGVFKMRMPAGTYNLSVYAPWGGKYGNISKEVEAISNGTVVVSLKLPEKSSVIAGKVQSTDGTGISGASVSCWSYNGTGSGDSAWTQADSTGAYTINAVEGLKYECSSYYWSSDSQNTYCSYTQEGTQSVVATSATQTVNFTYPKCGCPMTIKAVDGDGATIPSIYGGVNATPTSSKNGWYGLWGNFNAGAGTMNVEEGVEYEFKPSVWDQSYVQGESQKATCKTGGSSVSFSMLPVNSKIKGVYVDSSGLPLTLDQYSYLSVYCTKDGAYRNCTSSSTEYSCNVSEGKWDCGYWIDSNSGYASAGAGSTTTSITVGKDETVTHDLTFLKTAKIKVKVKKADGNEADNLWVDAHPFSAKDRGSNSSQYLYSSAGCMTIDGECTIIVGASSTEKTTWYVNANMPYFLKKSEETTNPQEAKAEVTAGETASVTLSFQKPDGKVTITVVQGSSSAALNLASTEERALLNLDEVAASPVANATVDLFSSSGGSFQVQTDESGQATSLCTTADTWQAVANNTVANALWMSDATKVTCSVDGGTGTLTLNKAATLPDGSSITIDDVSTQSLNVELSDGFVAFFPPGSLGTSGKATCNVEPTVTPMTATFRDACFYGYTIKCQDSSAAAITQLKNKATLTVPINETQVENVGAEVKDLKMAYWDDSTGAYTTIDTAAISDATNTISFQVDHLTDFAAVTNGNLAGLTGEQAGSEANEVATGSDSGSSGTGDSGTGSTDSAAASAGGCGCHMGAEGSPIVNGVGLVTTLLLSLGTWVLTRRRVVHRARP